MKVKDYFEKISQYDAKIELKTEELKKSKNEHYNKTISNEMRLISDRIERLRSYNSLLMSLSAGASDEANDFTLKSAKYLTRKFTRSLIRLGNSKAQLNDISKILVFTKTMPVSLEPFTSQEEEEGKYLLEGMEKELCECEKLWNVTGVDVADELSLFQREREV